MNVVESVFPGIGRSEEGHAAFVMVKRWNWRAISDMLDSEVFCGRPIRWRRGPGFLDATFEVVGEPRHVQQVEDRVNSWLGLTQ